MNSFQQNELGSHPSKNCVSKSKEFKAMKTLPFKDTGAALSYIEKFFSVARIEAKNSYYGIVVNINPVDDGTIGKCTGYAVEILAKGFLRRCVRKQVVAVKHPDLIGSIEVGDFVLWGAIDTKAKFPGGVILKKLSLVLDVEKGAFLDSCNLTSNEDVERTESIIRSVNARLKIETDRAFERAMSDVSVVRSRDIFRFENIITGINVTMSVFSRAPEVWDLGKLEVYRESSHVEFMNIISGRKNCEEIVQPCMARLTSLFVEGLPEIPKQVKIFTIAGDEFRLSALQWNQALIGKQFELRQNYLDISFNETGMQAPFCEVVISKGEQEVYVGTLKNLDGYYQPPVSLI